MHSSTLQQETTGSTPALPERDKNPLLTWTATPHSKRRTLPVSQRMIAVPDRAEDSPVWLRGRLDRAPRSERGLCNPPRVCHLPAEIHER